MSEEADNVKRYVRARFPDELLPMYSTDELLRGVCHIVVMPEIAVDKSHEKVLARARSEAKRRGASKGVETLMRLGAERFHGFAPRIKEMLEQAIINKVIAAKLGVSERSIDRYIRNTPELKAISAQRRLIRLKRSTENLAKKAQNIAKTSAEKFEERLPMIADMIAKGQTNKEIAARFGICDRVVTGYIAKSQELKILSEQRVAARKGASKRLEEIRGPITEMRVAGMKDAAIAKALGMGRGNLWKYMKMIEQENNHAEG